MLLKDLYKLMVSGQKLIIDELGGDEVYMVHSGTSDTIPLELLNKRVLQVNSDYSRDLTLYILIEKR